MDEILELTQVDVKEVWKHEANDFTPWLAANLDRLESLLGMELELEGTEVPVGPFWADIVLQEASTGRRVVVENMLGATDHDHLGKVLTYAAGLDAWYCVLVAREFRPEHRSALDWLNHSTDDVGFFGIQVSAVRIGDSPPAAQLSLVVEPDGWARQIPKAGLTATQQNYVEFWSAFLSVFNERHPNWGNVTKAPAANWINFPSGHSGVPFDLAFSWPAGSETYRIRVSLYISPSGEGDPDRVYDRLLGDRTEIEDRFGSELVWERNEDRISRRICVYSDLVDPTDTSRWPEYTEWMVENLSGLRSALGSTLNEAMASL